MHQRVRVSKKTLANLARLPAVPRRELEERASAPAYRGGSGTSRATCAPLRAEVESARD